MRLAITFLISFCFLLVRGNEHVYAHAHQTRVCYSPAKLANSSEDQLSGNVKNNLAVIHKSDASNTESDVLTATEPEVDDDDDLLLPRKFIAFCNYFFTFFYAQATGDTHQDHKKRLPLCEHFSYSSSSRYIIQRVIRI